MLIPLRRLAQHPSDTAAHLILLAFPRLVLRLTAATPSQSLTAACALLAQRFISGDWHALFLEASAAATPAARPLNLASARSTATQARLHRAARFAKCGDWSRSLAALEAGEFAPPSSETISSLSSKHPPAPQPLPHWISTFTPDSYPQLSAPLLHLALRSAPRGTAAGPSGWLIEHLRDTFLTSQQHLPSLLRLFQNWLQAELPLSVRSYYTASTLVALKKPQGGVRPIAIGEVLPRLLSRCITLMFKQQMRDTFLPCLQFGVAVPAGIEVMAHAVQSALSLHPDWAVLQLDVANAFNSFNRIAMFEALRSSPFSPLIPYFSLFYSSPSPLHYRNGPTLHTFESASGVRQGDPCGPFLYALTQQLAILPTQNQFPSIFISSYADDTFLVGPPSIITTAFTALTDRLHSLGLTVQPSKCSIWCPLDWPQGCATPSGVPIAPNGLNVAGVPIGSDGYIISTVQEKLASFTTSLPLLHQLHDPQTASRILSQCVSARPSFLLRTNNEPTRVHDAIKHELHRIILELGLVSQLEDHHLLPGRRPDITCRDLQSGTTLALDVSVADSQHGFPHSNAATVIGSAAATRETEKATLYAPSLHARPDVKLLPLALETFGVAWIAEPRTPELGTKSRPFANISGVCRRCSEQIAWRRKYGKYKPLTEPAKCQACGKRNVKDAYHAICRACAQEKGLCAKCRQPTKEIVQDGAAVRENEMKQLEEALGRLRERERRSLLRAVRACLSPLLRAVRACLSPLLRAVRACLSPLLRAVRACLSPLPR
ncbi:unnamed protein product [Closterium sp. NIES-64]|nr:unnamed protein product [Closterium sp. NIES-64]